MQDNCPCQIQRHGSLLFGVIKSQDSEYLSVQTEVSSGSKKNTQAARTFYYETWDDQSRVCKELEWNKQPRNVQRHW